MNSLIASFFRSRYGVASMALLAVCAGCGGTYDATVKGIAKMEGKPLSSGTVKFVPLQPGPSGYGMIDSTGAYEITTGREEGLPAGNYVVTVVSNEPSIPNKNPSLPPAPGKPITPAWYRNHETSPLKQTVEARDNEINLDLTNTPPAGWKPPRPTTAGRPR